MPQYRYTDEWCNAVTDGTRVIPCVAGNTDWDNIVASGVAVGPYQAPVPTSGDLKAHAAARRWAKETGGVAWGGLTLPTDDRAKLLIMGAAGSMSDAETAPLVLEALAVTLTGAQFRAAYGAITAHVQACFATQAAVLAAIDAGTATTIAQIDEAFT